MRVQLCQFFKSWCRAWWRGENCAPLDDPDQDVEIYVGSKPIVRVFRSKERVKEVLNDPDAQFTWPYTAFSQVLRQHDEIHHYHTDLARVIARVPWLYRMKELEQEFFLGLVKHKQRLDLAWKDYLVKVWFGACFDLTHLPRILQLQKSLQQELQQRFFQRNYWRIPKLGPWLAKKNAVPARLIQMIRDLPRDGFLADLEDTNVPLAEDAAVLSFLVFDFLYESGIEIMVASLSDRTETTPNWNRIFQRAFFFPWRLRWWKGTVVALNLQSARLFWSTGLHSCPGQSAAKGLLYSLYHLVRRNPWHLDLIGQVDRVQGERPLSHAVNVFVRLSRSLELPHQEDVETGRTLFHVNSIFWQPALMMWIKQMMVNQIVSELGEYTPRLVIVSPEARGWLLASAVAQHLHCPLVLARKGGKEKGTTVKQTTYQTIYSQEEVMEISQNAPLNPNSQVVVIDDGVASGGSLAALLGLIQAISYATPKMMLAVFRHHECPSPNDQPQRFGWRQQEIHQVPTYTLFDTYQQRAQ